jgi:hypothetical protein
MVPHVVRDYVGKVAVLGLSSVHSSFHGQITKQNTSGNCIEVSNANADLNRLEKCLHGVDSNIPRLR